MRHIITVHCNEEDVETITRAILRVRDHIQNGGNEGNIWLTSAVHPDEIEAMIGHAEAKYEADLTDWSEGRER